MRAENEVRAVGALQQVLAEGEVEALSDVREVS